MKTTVNRTGTTAIRHLGSANPQAGRPMTCCYAGCFVRTCWYRYDTDMDVGRFLREIRVEADLTQAALAHRAGTSQAAVARYESGVTSPAVATLERLLAACGRTLEIDARRTSTRDLSGVRARRLRAAKQELLRCAAQYGARNLRVFGSVARGDDNPDSDVDLLVDLDPGRGLLDLAELRDALSDLLGERVDVATIELLRPEVAEAAAAEAVPL